MSVGEKYDGFSAHRAFVQRKVRSAPCRQNETVPPTVFLSNGVYDDYPKTDYYERIRKNIFSRSKEKHHLKAALSEWQYQPPSEVDESSTSICGLCDHLKIRDRHRITNRLTGESLKIGNECIRLTDEIEVVARTEVSVVDARDLYAARKKATKVNASPANASGSGAGRAPKKQKQNPPSAGAFAVPRKQFAFGDIESGVDSKAGLPVLAAAARPRPPPPLPASSFLRQRQNVSADRQKEFDERAALKERDKAAAAKAAATTPPPPPPVPRGCPTCGKRHRPPCWHANVCSNLEMRVKCICFIHLFVWLCRNPDHQHRIVVPAVRRVLKFDQTKIQSTGSGNRK